MFFSSAIGVGPSGVQVPPTMAFAARALPPPLGALFVPPLLGALFVTPLLAGEGRVGAASILGSNFEI
jgi:hypothetical protein